MKCELCEKEYHPFIEFVEDHELIVAFDFFIDGRYTYVCPDCIYDWERIVDGQTDAFITTKTKKERKEK